MDTLDNQPKAANARLGTGDDVLESRGDPKSFQRLIWSTRPDAETVRDSSHDSDNVTTSADQPRFLGTSYEFHRCTDHARHAFGAMEAQLDALTKKYLEAVLFKSDTESYDAGVFDDSVTATSKNEFGVSYWEVFVPGVVNEGTFIPNDTSSLNIGNPDRAPRQEPEHVSKTSSTSGGPGQVIRVMSFDPTDIAQYGFVFATKDLPGLRARLDGSLEGNEQPSYLIAIDAAEPAKQYYLNWSSLQVMAPLGLEDALYYDPASMGNSYSCGAPAALQFEPAGEDWFG